MKIGEVARKAKVRVPTLRYYERRGLLPEPDRRVSGYREYRSDAVRLVRFIKRAQALGFTLDDVEQLLRLATGGPRSCRTVRTLARARIEDMSRKIEMLEAMRSSLERLVKTCHRSPGSRDCPLLDALEEASD